MAIAGFLDLLRVQQGICHELRFPNFRKEKFFVDSLQEDDSIAQDT
jgi:hypothetical protein